MSKHQLDQYEPRQSREEKSKRQTFGKECENIRRSLGLSLASMAKRMNVSEELIVRIENGKVSPDAPGIQRNLNNLQRIEKIVIA